MLTIKNIEIIRGLSAFGYVITNVTTEDRMNMSGDYYVFQFDRKFNDLKVEVYLNRHSDNKDGKYEMFVMGWGASTRIDVEMSDLVNASECASQIRKCLRYLEEQHNF